MRKSFPVILLFWITLAFFLPLFAQDLKETLKKGRAFEKEKKFEDALALYKQHLEKESSEEVYKEICSLLGKLRKYEDAEKILNDGLSKLPKSVSLLNLMGLIKLKRGTVQEAQAVWKKALTIDPRNLFAKQWLQKTKEKSSAPSIQSADFSPEPTAIASSEAKLSLAEQEKLALKLYDEMFHADKWEFDIFVKAHKEVIEKCPDVELAQESCWRLSNLYLQGYDEPDYDGIIEVLGHLIKNYPNSPFLPDAKNRLLNAFQSTGRSDKVVELYEELFKLNPQPSDRQFMTWNLEYGDALAAIGKKDEAKKIYEGVIQRDNNQDQLEARVARNRLSAMSH
ncbi:hypothetical protein HYY75_02025 [bacterium]|nr:hypothetical protein [bacterium]